MRDTQPGHSDQYEYELFVSYAEADRAWVKGNLVPALGLPRERVSLPRDFVPGAPVVTEFERAVTSSRYTLLVWSPAYIADEWALFSELLTSYASVAERRDRLIPLLLKPCDLPLRVGLRVHMDCTDPVGCEQELSRLRDLLDQPEPVLESIPCPYPGMVPFAEGEAQFLFGREAETDELWQKLRHQSCIYVIGPSGSGKSSLVFAGLLPKLREPKGHPWLTKVMRPGADPLAALERVLCVQRPTQGKSWSDTVDQTLAQSDSG